MTYHDLTEQQRILLRSAEQHDGDVRDYLRAHDSAPAEDKAAVAEVIGGPGAGAEFLR
jgi:hypothetical protein